MPLKINVPGAKPAASKGTAKRASTKRSTGAKPAAKRSTAKPAKPKAGRTNRSNGRTSHLDQTQLKQIVSRLKKAGERREKLFEDHKEAVAEVNEIATEALDMGVPMSLVSENAKVSRQWLYKQQEMNERDSSAKAKPRSSAKRSSTKRAAPAKRGSGRGRTAPKSGSKRSSGGLSIRTR